MSRYLESVIERLAVVFDPEVLGAATANLLANVVVGATTFFAYYLVWVVLDRVARITTGRFQLDRTTRDLMLTLLKFTMLTIAAVSAFSAVGVNTASLIASLGIAGLTIGFAAKDALSNMISGLMIYWDRPFVIGDLLEVGPHYGRVDRITLRSTRVITPDGRMLAVPNNEIINTTVASYTNFPHLRLDIPISIGVNEDISRVRQLLLGLLDEHPGFMADPRPNVTVTALNDFNVEVTLSAWVDEERDHLKLRAVLREAAYEALRAAEVDMPPETLRIEPLTLLKGAGA